MYYLPFEALVQELSEKWMGSQIELNGATSCVIRTDTDYELFLEADPKKPLIQIICFVGAVPKNKDSIPLLLRILQENLPPQDHGIFGIDVERNQFTLHKSYPLENLNTDDFSDCLLQLYNKSQYWLQVIKGDKPLPIKKI